MRGQVNRHHVENEFTLRRIEAIAAAREIGERRTGVDALVPSGNRIGQRAFDYRWACDGRRNRVACRQHQLLAETLGVAICIRPTPSERALAAHLLEPFLDPLLAQRVGDMLVAAMLEVLLGEW